MVLVLVEASGRRRHNHERDGDSNCNRQQVIAKDIGNERSSGRLPRHVADFPQLRNHMDGNDAEEGDADEGPRVPSDASNSHGTNDAFWPGAGEPLLSHGMPSRHRQSLLQRAAAAFRVDFSGSQRPNQALCPCLSRLPSRAERASRPVGPNEACCEGELRESYGEGNERTGDCTILVMKLALSLAASGMPTYGAAPLLHAAANAMFLPSLHLQLTMRSVQLNFGGGPVHICHSRQGKVIHRLTDLQRIALAISTANDPNPLLAAAAIDKVNSRPSNYGWAIEAAAYHGFAIFASQAIFGGSIADLVAVSILSLVVRLTMVACDVFEVLGTIRDGMLPLVVGAATPLVCRVAMGLSDCHSATAFLSLLLFELPGSELLFGASELKRGAMVGVTRLLNAICTTMFMALTLAVGWSATAPLVSRFAPEGDPEALNPWVFPGSQCPERQVPSSSLPSSILRNSLQLLPLEMCFFILVGIRPRNVLAPFVCVTATMALAYYLAHAGLPLAPYVSNTIALFVGANLGFAHEYFSPIGLSHQVVLLPITVLLAPGAGAFKAVVAAINASCSGGSKAVMSDALFDLMMQGVSFAVGESLAHSLWASALANRAAKNAHATAVGLSSSKTVCPIRLMRVVSKIRMDI